MTAPIAVVPAKAGTQYTQTELIRFDVATSHLEYWVPAFAGTTKERLGTTSEKLSE
jgi:hypothetical protein